MMLYEKSDGCIVASVMMLVEVSVMETERRHPAILKAQVAAGCKGNL
jgi:hypothetical protein